MKKALILLILIGMIAGGAAYYSKHSAADSTTCFRTAEITRGELLSTISATGTVEPEEVVNVGAQVAGLITEFGPDPNSPTKLIDYGSVVEKDTLLAKIDPTSYEAALEQAEAALENSQANLLQLQAKFDQTEQEWKRAESLRPKGAIADTDYDTSLANYKAARANVAVGKASIRQSKAALQIAKTNLGYTMIKSPVRGVILARRVNIGQTVVASLNAPSLFLIAKDLRRMQVWASVNEADIGQIHVGMPVRFTVDAHSGKMFRGKVTQIRMNATMTQNVVTYTVVVTTDNSNGLLLPYLTANVQFEVDHRTNVLRAPNAALRWKPQTAQIAPDMRDAVAPAASKKDDASSKSEMEQERGTLWVASEAGVVRPLEVLIGHSDGLMTEVSGAGVKEGLRVVVGEDTSGIGGEAEATSSDGDKEKTSNPFLPTLPKGAKRPPPPM